MEWLDDPLLNTYGLGNATPSVSIHPEQRRIVCSPYEVTDAASGMHKHRCAACGTTWKHPDAIMDASPEVKHEAHTCPKCGEKQGWKHFAPGDWS